MKLEKYTILIPVPTVEDFENMPEDQLDRLKELNRKVTNYENQVVTFISKYTGESMKHRTTEEVLNNYNLKNEQNSKKL